MFPLGQQDRTLDIAGDVQHERVARATPFGRSDDEHGRVGGGAGDARLGVAGLDPQRRVRQPVLVGGSPTLSVLEAPDTSVLVVERPDERSLLERLFGRR